MRGRLDRRAALLLPAELNVALLARVDRSTRCSKAAGSLSMVTAYSPIRASMTVSPSFRNSAVNSSRSNHSSSTASTDILITEIRLGGRLTGWDVAQSFRAANPAGRVIYASGSPVDRSKKVPDSISLSKRCNVAVLIDACRKAKV
jgi:hypothetical protein